MPNNSQIVSNKLIRSGAYTIAGGFFGAVTGAIAGSVGGVVMKKNDELSLGEAVKQVTLASTTGGAILCAAIGLLESTPLALSPLYIKMLCADQFIGSLVATVLYFGKDILATELGKLILSTMEDIPAEQILTMTVGSAATVALLILCFAIVNYSKAPSCAHSTEQVPPQSTVTIEELADAPTAGTQTTASEVDLEQQGPRI